MTTQQHPDPNVRADYGGWISGPCLPVPEPEPMPGCTCGHLHAAHVHAHAQLSCALCDCAAYRRASS